MHMIRRGALAAITTAATWQVDAGDPTPREE